MSASLIAWSEVDQGLVVVAIVACFALAALLVLRPVASVVLAVAIYVLVPTKVIGAVGLGLLPPTTVLMFIFAIRSFVDGMRSGGTDARTARLFAFLFLVYSIFLTIISLRMEGLGWLVNFGAAVLLMLWIRVSDTDRDRIERTILYLAIATSTVGIVEKVLGRLPLYDQLYAAVGEPSVQHWSTYRVESTFGHPLYASTFFGVAFVLASLRWVETRRALFAVTSILSGAALLLTVSRGGLLAAVVGLAFGLIAKSLTGQSRATSSRSLLGPLVGLGVLGVAVIFSDLGARLESDDARGSNFVRTYLGRIAVEVVRSTHWLGAGPGASADALRALNGRNYIVDSSALQIFVNYGIPGSILLLAMFASVVGIAVRGARYAPAAALVCFCVSISTYNAFDDLRPQHALLGALVILAACGHRDGSKDDTVRTQDGAAQSITESVGPVASVGLRSMPSGWETTQQSR